MLLSSLCLYWCHYCCCDHGTDITATACVSPALVEAKCKKQRLTYKKKKKRISSSEHPSAWVEFLRLNTCLESGLVVCFWVFICWFKLSGTFSAAVAVRLHTVSLGCLYCREHYETSCFAGGSSWEWPGAQSWSSVFLSIQVRLTSECTFSLCTESLVFIPEVFWRWDEFPWYSIDDVKNQADVTATICYQCFWICLGSWLWC